MLFYPYHRSARPFHSSRLLSLFEKEEERIGGLSRTFENKSMTLSIILFFGITNFCGIMQTYVRQNHAEIRDTTNGHKQFFSGSYKRWSIEIWINVTWKAIITEWRLRSLPIRWFLPMVIVRHRSVSHLAETGCAFARFLLCTLKIHFATLCTNFITGFKFRICLKLELDESPWPKSVINSNVLISLGTYEFPCLDESQLVSDRSLPAIRDPSLSGKFPLLPLSLFHLSSFVHQ